MKLSRYLDDPKAAELAQAQTFDLLKHIATIDLAGIAILAPLEQKFYGRISHPKISAAIFASLFLSLLFSIYPLIVITDKPQQEILTLPSKWMTYYHIAFLLAVAFFMVGLGFLLLYSLMSLE